MNAEAKRLLDQAMAMSHDAVMALERFREGAHLAVTADELAAAENIQQIGEIYVRHMRCCWCDELDQVARSRNRELSNGWAMTPAPPF